MTILNHGKMVEVEPGHFTCIHCSRDMYLLPEYKVMDKGDPDALHTGSTSLGGLEILDRTALKQISAELKPYEDYLNKLDF